LFFSDIELKLILMFLKLIRRLNGKTIEQFISFSLFMLKQIRSVLLAGKNKQLF
jgi:hypothetical protein